MTEPMIKLADLRNLNPNSTEISMPWAHLKDDITGAGDRRVWNLSPDYQRDNVWTTKQKATFIGCMLEGAACPPIWVQRWDGPKNAEGRKDYYNHAEVIDGKQRLTAILEWMDGAFAAELTDGRKVNYADVASQKNWLPDARVKFVDMSRKDRLAFYLRLNRGGTVHTDAEIEKVRNLLAAEG